MEIENPRLPIGNIHDPQMFAIFRWHSENVEVSIMMHQLLFQIWNVMKVIRWKDDPKRFLALPNYETIQIIDPAAFFRGSKTWKVCPQDQCSGVAVCGQGISILYLWSTRQLCFSWNQTLVAVDLGCGSGSWVTSFQPRFTRDSIFYWWIDLLKDSMCMNIRAALFLGWFCRK